MQSKRNETKLVCSQNEKKISQLDNKNVNKKIAINQSGRAGSQQ